MEGYKIRVIAEKESLDEKSLALMKFIESAKFKDVVSEEQDRMNRQLGIMREYSKILGERINAFNL